MKRACLLLVVLGVAALGCGDRYVGDRAYSADWAGMELFLEERCSNCHGYDPGQGNVQLPEDLIDDVASGAGMLVVAGDPDASYLWAVIDSGYMPAPARPLDPALITSVATWIEEGAQIP